MSGNHHTGGRARWPRWRLPLAAWSRAWAAPFRVLALAFLVFASSGALGQAALAAPGAPPAAKPAPGPQTPIQATVPAVHGGRSGDAAVPAVVQSPAVLRQQALAAIQAQAGAIKPQPPQAPTTPLPAHGTVVTSAAAVAPGGRAGYWNGSAFVQNQATPPLAPGTPNAYLGIPAPAPAAGPAPQTPSTFYGSTQVDAYTGCSAFGANEASVAQSTSNPNFVVVAAQMYQNANGTCGDSHAFAFYSHDGGQHWKQTALPGLVDPVSGDTAVTYDPKHNVFVFSFLEFSRTSSTVGRIGVEVSSDGASWGSDTTLDSNSATIGVDKDMITVDQNPGSPHYGRVAVTWTEFPSTGGLTLRDAYTDNGGVSWSFGLQSINFASSSCGNGTSPAFDAGGELMAAWWDCNTSPAQLREELSTDGGANWLAPSDTTITNVNSIGGATNCILANTVFRCNSFPSLAGDPNSADEGAHAFEVVWANMDSGVTDSRFPGVTHSVSEIHGLSTVNGGGAWNGGPSFSFDYMCFNNFGDKFFPWIAFAPNGRFDVGFSDREDNASAANPEGTSFDEHGTQGNSLASLFADSFVTYTDDGTLANPGSLTFIGDYSGMTSLDNNFDSFPVWTDVRGGSDNVRTMDLCYVDCYTFLAPYTPLSAGSTSPFTDLYQFNTDAGFGGAGNDFWNAVGIREGTNGATVDDDQILYNSRYFSTQAAFSDESPPFNDYLLENDNSGHSPNGPYFPQVHSFSAGPYTVEWASGSVVIIPGSRTDSFTASHVVHVYDSFLATSTTYHFGVRPAAGNTSQLSLSLHSASRGNDQGRNNAAADSGAGAVGQSAFISYATGTDPTQYDGVVVLNNNGGAGSYTLYEDTAAPTGTISINGGAAATNSTAVTLTLTGSNPTAGDPVLDMRFSNDGVTFGAWQPFAASAPYTLTSGDGTKTVFVEWRNGAGVISAPQSASILLDTVAPTTTASLSGTQVCSGTGAYVGSAQVTLTATDNSGGSGVASTVYQLDGGAVTTYSGPFSVTTTGSHTVTFHSTDHAGNVESTNSVAFSIVADVGGRCLTLTNAPPNEVTLSWTGGTVQAGYAVLRFTSTGQSDLTNPPLGASATSFTDSSPVSPFSCYVLVPLNGSGAAIGQSDLLCYLAGYQSASDVPTSFSIALDESTTASFTWGAPATEFGYVLYGFPNGGPVTQTMLASTATSATSPNTVQSCYILGAIASGGATLAGNTNGLCAIPGFATVHPATPTSLSEVQSQTGARVHELRQTLHPASGTPSANR